MATNESLAPGWPGLEPRWTSSAKSGVGTALSQVSHVWFTLSHGILNEVYFRRLDCACLRDLGLIVTQDKSFLSEEKRHTNSIVSYLSEGVPAHRLINTCQSGRYRIEKEIIADPLRPVILQQIRFLPLQGARDSFELFALAAPHLGNRGRENTAFIGNYKSVPMLFAERDGLALALACSSGWQKRSVGFVGQSDGWQDLEMHQELTWEFTRAENGNVALTGQIALTSDEPVTLALAFGRTPAEAGFHAAASLAESFADSRAAYIADWKEWQATLRPLDSSDFSKRDLYRVSTAVLRTHEAKQEPGAVIASLSIPWGATHGDDNLGGYHLVWPRDMVEAAGALLAAGADDDVQRLLKYLRLTQEEDGHWPQNMWIDSTPYWNGIQMDETALAIVLVGLAHQEGIFSDRDVHQFWPMIRKAASYVICHGPVTQEDRWEEDQGYTAFTLASEIAGLLVAADFAELAGELHEAAYLRETADVWNASIERWIYVTGTELAQQVGVDGYYCRIAPDEESESDEEADGTPVPRRVHIANRLELADLPAGEVVSPDALALVRFGLRAADDPRIVNTVRVLDALLKTETPHGPCWYRYNEDGYGEHADGSSFDGTGIGRPWPLLTGERAHYEIAADRLDEATRLLHTLESFASDGGLIPEQIWDQPDVARLELYQGRPSGSAMPLVWAHAEYIKLRRSLLERRVFDMPVQTARRYLEGHVPPALTIWRFNQKCTWLQRGTRLRLEVLVPATIHWSTDHWKHTHDINTRDSRLGMYVVDLPTDQLPVGSSVQFTFYWRETQKWEGTDFAANVLEGVGTP